MASEARKQAVPQAAAGVDTQQALEARIHPQTGRRRQHSTPPIAPALPGTLIVACRSPSS